MIRRFCFDLLFFVVLCFICFKRSYFKCCNLEQFGWFFLSIYVCAIYYLLLLLLPSMTTAHRLRVMTLKKIVLSHNKTGKFAAFYSIIPCSPLILKFAFLLLVNVFRHEANKSLYLFVSTNTYANLSFKSYCLEMYLVTPHNCLDTWLATRPTILLTLHSRKILFDKVYCKFYIYINCLW